MRDEEYFHIRPSQVARTFGPGSIYDNQRDSMIIMGLDYWRPEKFNAISDEILLQEIKKKGFDGVVRMASVSSFKDPENPGTVPVQSFPTWGFCPRCHKLVPNRNNKTGRGITCDSAGCKKKKRTGVAEIPKTHPVRFVAVCENGHLDDFPWYRWVHRTSGERDACGPNDAELYLVYDKRSISLASTRIECRRTKCASEPQSMAAALSKGGLRKCAALGCTGRRPWLGGDAQRCSGQMRGIYKGAANIYFPLVRSAVTIPPFSDELSEKIIGRYDEILRLRNDYPEDYKKLLVSSLQLRPKYPDGKWTINDALKKISALESFNKRNGDKDVYRLEFDALNSREDFSDAEFVTENLEDVPAHFRGYIDHAVLVKKIRVVSALTGFTRIDPFDPDMPHRASDISKSHLTWLPVVENRGEGIFFCVDDKNLEKWQAGREVGERLEEIMTVQGRANTDQENYMHHPRYIFLHTLSHVIIRELSSFAGYATASLTERIYSGDGMAGILIYTSSPSSDGALGGLADLGRKSDNRIWHILENAVRQTTQCSCDPFCSMQEAEKTPNLIGASCHACTLLPETSCESVNNLLDREMVSRTLKSDIGFVRWRA